MKMHKNKEMKDSQDITLYIVDYLTGQISKEGACALEQWVLESDENREHFIRMREAWMGSSIIEHTYDGEMAFLRFKKRVLKLSNISKSTWIQRYQSNVRDIMRWAAVILLPVLLTCTTIMYFNISSLRDGEMVASTAIDETSTLQLPDGTQVMLKENSQLSYSSSDFAHGNRTIQFQGSAYFHVSSDAEHPFLITTEKEQVRVLGTEFFLVSEKGSWKDILSLDKGKVEFIDNKSGKAVYMETGDELVYNTLSGKTYCRSRCEDEVKLAQETYKNNIVPKTIYAELEQNIRNQKGSHTIQLNVSKNLKAGVYQVEITPDKEMACFTPSRDAAKFVGGDGSQENPYLISNARQMCNMKSVLTPYKMTYFALTNDIDLQGVEWVPLNDRADEYSLWITLNGNGHVIRNLTTSRSCYYGSFFGVLCGTCRNVGFENVDILCTGYGAGAVAGYLGHAAYPNVSRIENCYATGRVSNKSYAGGLVGNVGSKAALTKCYADVDVSSSNNHAGGLVGNTHVPFDMEDCYSSGDSGRGKEANSNYWRKAWYSSRLTQMAD